ncbi:MAG: rubrerythrin family protein [Alphaproteobacteria bacterium]|nr:rubrerythrin family protein [Alphaproteobacteria bacterium]MBL0717791.1 rubrerythrin family protein [Alphaproteobacteria bacterium]
MNKLNGTKTLENICQAFLGESQASNRYLYFAPVAEKEGFIQISEAFKETAKHEQQHAKRLFKLAHGCDVKMEVGVSIPAIGTTEENLAGSADGENYEHSTMYPDFAKVARDEGFENIAKIFDSIAIAEQYHEERFKAFRKNIQDGTVFKKDGGEKTTWKCLNCGYQHSGDEAPLVCPACEHKQEHFEVMPTNW